LWSGIFFFGFFFGQGRPFVSTKNQIETAIAMRQIHIETMARALTISGGKWWLLVTQKSTFISYPQCRKA
jgi:hypothetical protein